MNQNTPNRIPVVVTPPLKDSKNDNTKKEKDSPNVVRREAPGGRAKLANDEEPEYIETDSEEYEDITVSSESEESESESDEEDLTEDYNRFAKPVPLRDRFRF